MTTILFVHGTGVRSGYREDLALVSERLGERLPDITVAACHWADQTLGLRTDLHLGGASIPPGRFARGEELADDPWIALWGTLYGDPLYELRMLAVLPGDPDIPVDPDVIAYDLDALRNTLASFTPSSALDGLLATAGLTKQFAEACSDVAAAEPMEQLIAAAVQPTNLVRSAVARAVVAQALAHSQSYVMYSRAASDADLRDSVVDRLNMELSGVTPARGAADLLKQGTGWLVSQSKKGGYWLMGQGTTWYLRRDSSVATHFAFPFSGDIMLYQRNGGPIRDFVQSQIAACTPPVIILAHSLGGVICFDLLNLHDLSGQVSGLITAGSQAPLLFELDVLAGRRFGETLPKHFPRWLNLYDRRDLLSFVGEKVFPDRITDREVDNRQPFPQAHSSYWSNQRLWDDIKAWLQQEA